MRDLGTLFIHLPTTIVKLMGPGGSRAVIAESLLVKHQLVILNRGRERAPNLRPMDRVVAGLCALLARRPRPDSPPQVARFSVSRAVSPWASQSPAGVNDATPAKSRARRSRAEFRNFSFSDFWGREGETPRTRRVISEPSPSRYPCVSLHFRHLGIGQFRFGTGSGSSQVRAALICCTSWVFIMCRAISAAKIE
jgi:hypothetical protein